MPSLAANFKVKDVVMVRGKTTHTHTRLDAASNNRDAIILVRSTDADVLHCYTYSRKRPSGPAGRYLISLCSFAAASDLKASGLGR